MASPGLPVALGSDGSRLVCEARHSITCTLANEADVAHAHELLHGQETQVQGDSGYTGLPKRAEVREAQAS